VVALAVLGILGVIVYSGAVAVMLGPRWFREFRQERRS